MSSFIRFRALSGARDDGPLCYLLQIDDAKILLDCGWSDNFDTDCLIALAGVAKQADAVLISHADLDHLGAFPFVFAVQLWEVPHPLADSCPIECRYAVTKLGLSCPAYSTFPVHDIGLMCMYDAYQSKRNVEDFTVFTAADIDAAFGAIVPLRYSQPLSLTGKCKGITITAYNAGHTLGGTIWKIRKDTDEVVYAVDYNHMKDRSIARLLDSLRNQANILIPVESATRSLELTYLLDVFWTQLPELNKYSLMFLSNQSVSTINVAKRMLEWMGESMSSLLGQDRRAPFDFAHLKTMRSLAELESITGPKVILASLSSLDWGYAHQLFVDWCASRQNVVILPDRGPPNSLARRLYDECRSLNTQPTDPLPNLNFDLNLMERQKVPLAGDELAQYMAKEALRLEKEKELEASRARSMMDVENDSELSDDDNEDEIMAEGGVMAGGEGGHKAASNQFDIYVKDSMKTSSFFKQSQSFKMFPCVEYRGRVDDYGEAVDPLAFSSGDARMANEEEAADELPALPEVDPIVKERDDVPSKYISTTIKVEVRCKAAFIDFEGRSDSKAIKNILPQVAARKIIFVHGPEECMEATREFCAVTDTMTKECFFADPNEWMNVSSATNIYQIRLTDSLASSLSVAKINDYELAYVTGICRVQRADPDDPTAPTAMPVLDLVPAEQRRSHPPVIVGDLRLSEFRRTLIQNGFEAEFVAGVLVVNRSLYVRRSQQGRLLIEGPYGGDYHKLRKLLYASTEIAILM